MNWQRIQEEITQAGACARCSTTPGRGEPGGGSWSPHCLSPLPAPASCCREAEPGHPAEPPARDFIGLGPPSPIFLVKYELGISHNICTKVRRELEGTCPMIQSWDALSAGKTERSPGSSGLPTASRAGTEREQSSTDPKVAPCRAHPATGRRRAWSGGCREHRRDLVIALLGVPVFGAPGLTPNTTHSPGSLLRVSNTPPGAVHLQLAVRMGPMLAIMVVLHAPPATAQARVRAGQRFMLWGNFLRFLIITGN